ncbi:unnamed protein product [Trichogramma brassicae]|uniref:Uncharacterized protein n=1 Tax=Trichogramma brassicae TaxID=86971 RepID=A0A6H5IRR2_9HYME|nr:unnamed protein product [Trichogramma brassicae]
MYYNIPKARQDRRHTCGRKFKKPDPDNNGSEDDILEQFPDVSSLLQPSTTDADEIIEMLDEDRELVMSTIKNIETSK